jgi:cyclase
VLLACVCIGLPAQGAEVTLKTTQVRDNIYMIEGVNGFAGGNVAISVGADGVLVVDSLVSSMTDKLTASLAKLSSNELRYLLNTHWHGDHSGGNEKLGKRVPIIAHDNVRKRMQHKQKNYFGAKSASVKEAWPVLTFNV